jgi:hypothetical protein
MGRPPIGKTAMTAAEKQRRYRERKFGNKAAVTKPDGKQSFGNEGVVTKRIAELEAEVARLTAANAELARVRELEAEIASVPPPGLAKQADAASLPKSYRERFEAMCRRQAREFEWRVKEAANVEGRKLLDEIFLPNLRKRLEEAENRNKTLEQIFERRPLISKALFRKALACLHPDSRAAASEKMFNEVFAAFSEKDKNNINKIEIALCGKEADRVPRAAMPTLAEMMAAREKVRAENSARAKRAAATRAAKAAEKKD